MTPTAAEPAPSVASIDCLSIAFTVTAAAVTVPAAISAVTLVLTRAGP